MVQEKGCSFLAAALFFLKKKQGWEGDVTGFLGSSNYKETSI